MFLYNFILGLFKFPLYREKKIVPFSTISILYIKGGNWEIVQKHVG